MLEIMYAPWFMCVFVCVREIRVCTTEFVCQTTNYCTNVLRADLGNVMLTIFWVLEEGLEGGKILQEALNASGLACDLSTF